MPYQALGAGFTTSANPATVPLSAPASHDIWLIASAPAYLNTPAGWTLVDTLDTLPGWGAAYIFRLAAASNPSGLASVAVSWSGAARRVGYAAWADDPATSIYGSVLEQGPNTATPALWGTGVHTFTTRARSFAFFSAVSPPATVTGQIVSADQGYAVAQQVGTVPTVSGEESPWVGVLRKDAASMSSNGVTATLNGERAAIGLANGNAAGMLAYDVTAPPPTPANTTAPAITGTATVGQTLSCSQGSWLNSPTSYAYQWKRNGTNIGGATASTYLLAAPDAGQSITCMVTATNASGSTSATSNAVSVAGAPAAPANTTAPAVTGTASTGQTLTCSTGSWSNSPTSYAYAWKRNGSAIGGATASSYVLTGVDVGQTILCTVTATNATGSASANSNAVTPTALSKLTIAQENALPGEEINQVAISGAGDPANQGFARPFSANVGETVNFACHGTGVAIDVYRIGYYGGAGWSDKKVTLTNTATSQPNPQSIANSNGGSDCGNWANTASWAVPANATPGLYVGVFRSVPGPNASYIPFVIRDDARPAAIMYKTADATWGLAYNHYGTPASPFTGKSVYGAGGGLGDVTQRTHVTSYDKPIVTRQGVGQTYWMACEAPIIRYLERMGLDVTYTACRDWREGSPVTPAACSVYISPGHDEYWDQGMRDKWIALRNAGKHLLFMCGNEVFWRVRYTDGGQRMWCYKDTMGGPGAHVAGTPLDPVSWTGTWKDTRWASRAPENTITGTDFRMNGVTDRTLVVPAGSATHPFWRSTDVNANGLSVPAMVGFEADEMKVTQPAESCKVLCQTTIDATGLYADDNGQDYGGTKTNMAWGVVSQRYASGAVVVGFGTCQWGWGLDATHDRGSNVASSRVQQATYNLLRDLGVPVAATPISGLTAPTPQSLDVYGAIPGATVRTARLWRSHNGAWEEIRLGP